MGDEDHVEALAVLSCARRGCIAYELTKGFPRIVTRFHKHISAFVKRVFGGLLDLDNEFHFAEIRIWDTILFRDVGDPV